MSEQDERNLTKMIMDLADFIVSRYSSDFEIIVRRVPDHFCDNTEFTFSLMPWGTKRKISEKTMEYPIVCCKEDSDIFKIKMDVMYERILADMKDGDKYAE